MKTQVQKPAHGQASDTEEYKQQALELWRRSGRSAAKVAAELGIRAALIYEWTKQRRPEVLDLFARAMITEALVTGASRSEVDARVIEVRRRVGARAEHRNV